jgi:hypothetical protein
LAFVAAFSHERRKFLIGLPSARGLNEDVAPLAIVGFNFGAQ